MSAISSGRTLHAVDSSAAAATLGYSIDYDLTGQPNRGMRDTIRVMLVGQSPREERLLTQLGNRLDAPRFEWTLVERLELAWSRLGGRAVDVLLVALSSESDVLDSLPELIHRHPSTSVVAVAPAGGESLGLSAIHLGAQDYIVSGTTGIDELRRVLRTAVERNRLWSALRETALIDELTGLYNRRGFLALARQQLRLARRAGIDAALLFVDVDGMKGINDTLGHRHGDMALIETADLLRASFRDTDLIGRIGGDEFVILAIEASDGSTGKQVEGLRQRVLERNRAHGSFDLSLSIGTARYTPEAPCPIEALLALADAAMYEQKQRARTAAVLPANVELLTRIA